MDEIISEIQLEQFKKDLENHGSCQFVVKGGCMWPFLKDDTVVVIEPVRTNDIVIGDIVLTHVGRRFFCHRVALKGKDTICTKADALVGFDEKAGQEDILGRVTAIKKDEKTILVNGIFYKVSGFIIVWLTMVTAPFYPLLRKIKKKFL